MPLFLLAVPILMESQFIQEMAGKNAVKLKKIDGRIIFCLKFAVTALEYS
jgi:hypothetical protein